MAALSIIVKTFDMATGNEESSRAINFIRPADRTWFDKHLVWAINNQRGVQIFHVRDEAAISDKEPKT